jgi:hypothetical protein
MIFKPMRESRWHTVLAVDAMYFQSARQAFANAEKSVRGVDRAKAAAAKHLAKMHALNELLRNDKIDDSTHYDRFEPLAIQMESFDYRVGAAHGVLLGYVGVVHMLSAASLEAFVNIKAEDRLSSRQWKMFERLPIDAKWMLLPRFLGYKGFDAGS